MTGSDNPIGNIVNNVLGLGGSPKSFDDKIRGLRDMLSLMDPNLRDGDYVDLMRADKHFSVLQGSNQARTPSQISALEHQLTSRGLLPSSSSPLFYHLKHNGGRLYYNQEKNSLYYGTGEAWTPLPLSGRDGTISLGGKERKVNSLLSAVGDEPSSIPFLNSYYTELSRHIRSSPGSIHEAHKKVLKTSIGKRLMEGVTTRGIYTPEEGLWTSGRGVLVRNDFSSSFYEALDKHRIGTVARAQLLKTGGRSINDALKKLNNNDFLTAEQAFALSDKYSNEYLTELQSLLEKTGGVSNYVYTKPEYLGQKDKVLIGTSSLLNKVYGTKFEKHVLTKGLFQLAKLKRNAEGTGLTPFVVRGNVDFYRSTAFNVAVVSTENQAISKLLFQEGGSIVTEAGARKLKFQANKGSIKFASPSTDLIAAVQRLYGVNVGEGYSQMLSAAPQYTKADYRAAMKGGDDLTSIQKDIRLVADSSPKYKGVLGIMSKDRAVLAKLHLTESALQLDFITKHKVLPGASEILLGGRRSTANVVDQNHRLYGLLNQYGMEGVDLVVGADEFLKMHGPNVYLTNFIQKVQSAEDAGQIFKEAFGHEGHVAVSHKERVRIPFIVDADSAYDAAKETVERWKKQKSVKYQRLAHEIEHGTSVVYSNFKKMGIASISVFGMEGGIRTDFLGDMNMMKPTNMSPGKMMTIASGSKLLGYSSIHDDPLYNSLANSNSLWRTGAIGISEKTGSLFLSDRHLMSRFVNALSGNDYTPDPSSIVTMKNGHLFHGDRQLASLPSDIKAFGHHEGGVPLSRLKDTILGLKSDMVYLDMGTSHSIDLLGTGKRNYRYLPVPLQYLRVKDGPHGKLLLGKTHPSHEFVKQLIESQTSPSTLYNGSLQAAYRTMTETLVGNKGLFNLTNTIQLRMGTRVRLAAQSGDHFGNNAWNTTDTLYDNTISHSDFEDYLARKSGISKKEARYLRKHVREKNFFYSALIADPMQRAEHAEIYRTYVKGNIKSEGLGQLVVNMHPTSYRKLERDTDRDAISLSPLSNSRHAGSMDALYEDRITKQKKLMSHALWFDKYQNMKEKVSAEGRLANITLEVNPGQYLPEFLGVPKSLGYSAIRSSDAIMSHIASGGAEAAAKLGILGKNITPGIINQIAQTYVEHPKEFSAVQRSLQILYQGAVQKGTDKGGLLLLTEDLITKVGYKYKGDAFDIDAIYKDSKEIIRDFISSDGMKDRLFADLDYLVEAKMLPADSTRLMQNDLERALTETLDTATITRMKAFRESAIDAQATLMSRYLGPAFVMAASVQKGPKTPIDIVRKVISETNTPAQMQAILETVSSSPFSTIMEGIEGNNLAEDILKEINEKAAAAEAKATNSVFKKLKTFFSSSQGKTFGAGVGVGVLAGAGIHAMVSGPDVPMPREIDARQPMDVGPTVFASRPKIYGTNQNFNASQRRSPETFSPMGSYSFPGHTDSSITIRDRRSPNNPQLLASQMRQISNSDYQY